MDHTIEHKLADSLPAMQRVLHTLYVSESESRSLNPVDAQCIVDCDLDDSPIRIDAGATPVIRVSGSYFMLCVVQQRTDILLKLLRKAIVAAHTRLRRTLSRPIPAISIELDSAGKFKIVASDGWTLPDRAFTVTHTITVTCATTGISETAYTIPPHRIPDAIKELQHRISALALASEQAAQLIQFIPLTTLPSGETISEGMNGSIVENITYE